jgi:hypothetical protein
VKKSVYRFERRQHDQAVALDRRKHDDDLAERIIGGVRTWSPDAPDRAPIIKRHIDREKP